MKLFHFMDGKVINVRKLVALDIVLHGPKFILTEFGVGPPTILAVGLWLVFTNAFLLGLYLFFTGINYVPLLIYAIVIARGKTANLEVTQDLERDKHFNRKYSTQQLMIFIPFAILILAIAQAYFIKK
jgi:hypothetical protein